MKIMTYNVNGIRSALNKDFLDFIKDSNPDIVCLQELKATEDQIPIQDFIKLGYHCYWFSAQKKGYSGTAILTKLEPQSVVYGCNNELYDNEGRVLRADFNDFSVISAYFPSGSSGEERQDFKMIFLDYFLDYLIELRKKQPKLILCGDYNICHKPIDIHDPIRNKNSSGFLPEEREWMDKFFDSGFIDTYRLFNPEPHNYSWWSYRAAARTRNKGWRIDYIAATEQLRNNITASYLQPEFNHSDHCSQVTEFVSLK